jgi:hypothetical protein
MKIEAKTRLQATDEVKVPGFKPASEYTKEIFNKYGTQPFDAILECTMREPGYASYDLTILEDKDAKCFYAAHGSVLMKDQPMDSAAKAGKLAMKWYEANKQRAAKR